MIKVQFLMTIASTTGINKVELQDKQDITVLDALKEIENQESKDIISKIMTPEQDKFKPGVLILAGEESQLKPANWQTVLKNNYLLKVTTIVGGG